MTWTNPNNHVWTTSEVMTAANLNSYISGNLAHFANFAQATVATSETTTSTSYTDLATVGPAVTTSTSTVALVCIAGNLKHANIINVASMAFAISGATTLAAADTTAMAYAASPAGASQSMGLMFVQTGLTAGSNTFTAKYKSNSANTATFKNRQIAVIAVGAP